MPTDHPIPDDLVAKLALAMSDEWNATMATGPKDATVPEEWDEAAQAALAAVAEWADGSLIDPETWEVMEAKPAERWHNLYDLDGKVICNHPERDHCSRADEGDWSNWTYTLRARGGDPR